MKEKRVQQRLLRFFSKEIEAYIKLCADFERRITKDCAIFQEQLDLKRKELEKMVGGSLVDLGVELPVLGELPASPAVARAEISGKIKSGSTRMKAVKKSSRTIVRGDFLKLLVSAVPAKGIKAVEIREVLLAQGVPRRHFKGNWHSRLSHLVNQKRLRRLKRGTYKPGSKS